MPNGQPGGGGSAQLETGSIVNTGSGAGVLQGITGGVATLRSIKAGTNVTVTEEANDILLDASGGGGGLSQGDANQLFVNNPSAICRSSSPANVGSITCTVDATGPTILTCSADVRPYLQVLSVVGTAGQSGKCGVVGLISGDGLTVTLFPLGGDNPLATDAVASQLVLFGSPAITYGSPLASVSAISYKLYAGDLVTVYDGIWTGPLFTAGEWFTSGHASGFVISADGKQSSISAITSHALVTSAISIETQTGTLANNTADQVTAQVDAAIYRYAIVDMVVYQGANKWVQTYQWYFYDSTHSDGGAYGSNAIGALADVNIGGGSWAFSGTKLQLKLSTNNDGQTPTWVARIRDAVLR